MGSGFQNPPAQNNLGFQGLNQQVPVVDNGAQHLPAGSFGGNVGDQGVYSNHYYQFNPQVGNQGVEILRPRMVEVMGMVRDNQQSVGEGSGRAPTGEQDVTWAYSDVSNPSNTYESLYLDGSQYAGEGATFLKIYKYWGI